MSFRNKLRLEEHHIKHEYKFLKNYYTFLIPTEIKTKGIEHLRLSFVNTVS